jgi:hypothetical protein
MTNPIEWIWTWLFKRRMRREMAAMNKRIAVMSESFKKAMEKSLLFGATVDETSDALRAIADRTSPMTAKQRSEMAESMRRGAAAGRRFRRDVSRGIHADAARTDRGPLHQRCQCGRMFTTLVLIDGQRYWECAVRPTQPGHDSVAEHDIDPWYLTKNPSKTVKR